jgi:hypothetical protein
LQEERPRDLSPIPIPSDYTVLDFCHDYKLDQKIEDGLNQLGWSFDNLKDTPRDVYEPAGLTFFKWKRVGKAYRAFHSDGEDA